MTARKKRLGITAYRTLAVEFAFFVILALIVEAITHRTAWGTAAFGLVYLTLRVVRVGRAMFEIERIKRDPLLGYLYAIKREFGGVA